MTGGQAAFSFGDDSRAMLAKTRARPEDSRTNKVEKGEFVVVCADENELAEHAKWIMLLGDDCLWTKDGH